MELLLGSNYHEITSSIDHGQAPLFPERVVTHSYLPNPKGSISLVYQTKIDLNKVSKKEAVDADALYDRYYLSEALKSQIKDNVYDDELDLLAQRFSNYLNLKDQKKNKLSLEGKITAKVRNKLENVEVDQVTDQNINAWTEIIINQLKKIKKNNINNDNEGYAIGYCKAQFEVYRDLKVMEEENSLMQV